MAGLSFDHLAIPVRDLAAAHSYYRDVLGLTLVDATQGEDWDGYPWIMAFYALADGRQLALCSFRGTPAPEPHTLPADARHFALAADALEPWRARLKARGIAWREDDHCTQKSL